MLARNGPLFAALLLCVAHGAGTAVAQSPAAPAASPPASTAPTPLDRYLDGLHTLRTTFLQTLADPHGREIDRATGTLIVQRPGKFSWDIHPQPVSEGAEAVTSGSASGGAGQLMVCDGTNLWFYDRDLQQVTVKPVDAALSATPAMLLSGAVDVRKSFTISTVGEREGLDWVLVEPTGAQADFRSALFGFEHGELRRMILEDKLDQTATIIFEKIERNGPVRPAEVSFRPPAGADLIGKPRR
ncbi:MAG TPA: outer-membrane lipoprotein carrier protein LolA [Steroidobacteraceae bacterium]|nr:outer-membrane lipoprotein carrier protein LolA [Steroidobacteraceae bacterium]